MKTVLFSDLDNTLIFSRNALDKSDERTIGKVVVEEYEHKPLSYMGLETYMLLQQEAGKSFEFIPTTTRSPLQYKRIEFPGVKVNTAITLNGAKILRDGKEDKEWTQKSRALADEESHSPSEVYRALVDTMADVRGVKATYSADGFFSYLVADSHTDDIAKRVKELANRFGHVYSKQGQKFYLIPPSVTKGRAIEELSDEFASSFASGDSVLDLSMAASVGRFISPLHGVIRQNDAPNIEMSAERGTFSSLALIEAVVEDGNRAG